MAHARLWGSHWRGSPYDQPLKKASRIAPRSGEISEELHTPDSHSQQAFQTFGDWLQQSPRPSSASGGWWVLRQ